MSQAEQRPLNSGFDAATTAADVIKGIDLHGKTIIVTGGYSGLGVEAVKVFAGAGAKVIVPTRDLERARKTVGEYAELAEMDLLDPQSIDRFATQFLQSGRRLDVLVNNAGVMAIPTREVDARGFEKQFATNHLGHFQLTLRLKPAFAPKARIVSVSSLGHRYSPVEFDDIQFVNRPYDRWNAYGQSKTANILFAVELDRRWKKDGIRAFSMHPGSIAGTGLQKFLAHDEMVKAGLFDENGEAVRDPSRNLKTPEQGAATIVWLATSPMLNDKGGLYAENCDISPILAPEDFTRSNMADSRRLKGVLAYAIDPTLAAQLWKVSETLTGVHL